MTAMRVARRFVTAMVVLSTGAVAVSSIAVSSAAGA